MFTLLLGGCGFDPQPSHFKNETLKMVQAAFFFLVLSIKKVELEVRTGQLSVSIKWLGGI